jgi:hypothetical protein
MGILEYLQKNEYGEFIEFKNDILAGDCEDVQQAIEGEVLEERGLLEDFTVIDKIKRLIKW